MQPPDLLAHGGTPGLVAEAALGFVAAASLGWVWWREKGRRARAPRPAAPMRDRQADERSGTTNPP